MGLVYREASTRLACREVEQYSDQYQKRRSEADSFGVIQGWKSHGTSEYRSCNRAFKGKVRGRVNVGLGFKQGNSLQRVCAALHHVIVGTP